MRNIHAVFLFIMFYFDYICTDKSGGWGSLSSAFKVCSCSVGQFGMHSPLATGR